MQGSPNPVIYDFDGFRLDAGRRLLSRADNESIPLTPKIFDTLLYLVQNGGKLIGKNELISEIWTDTVVEENSLNKNISVLRGALGEKPGEHRFIVTVPGQGYRFVAEVSAIGAETQNSNAPETRPRALSDAGGRGIRRFALALVIFSAAAATLLYFWRPWVRPSAPNTRTIAVLPFKSLTAENRSPALEMGMADALISKLGGGEVIVRPLSSVSRFSDLNRDALADGRELSVEVVLDGTIQTAGDKIRVSANLFRVEDGKQLWTGQFNEDYTNIFAVQDSISEKVAAALKITFGDSGKKHYPQNIEAYQLYAQGRAHLVEATTTEIQRAIAYFQQAIEADPSYALAYVGLADAYRGLATGGEMPSAEYFPKAKAAAQRAVELDDNLADGHAILGHVIFWYDWDWGAADVQYKRAIELDPNNANAHLYYAHLLSNTGRHAEALAEIRRAHELDPSDLRINSVQGLFLLHAGQTDDAVLTLQKTISLAPDYRLAHSFLARAYIEKGMFTEAIAETEKARQLTPFTSEPVAFDAYAASKSGKLSEAHAILDRLLKTATERYVPPYNIALVYDGLGDREKALDYLEKAFESKDVRMVFLKVEPKWKDLHSHPRFIDLLRRMKL